MEGLHSIWSYQEMMDELKQKLVYTNLELESVRIEANEEVRKNRENMKHLLDLLKLAYQERDEARDRLQKMLEKLMPSSPPELQTMFHLLQPESPLLIPTKANSGITESNSLSETYNPPVDSFFESDSNPDFSSINMAAAAAATDSSNVGFLNHNLVPEHNVDRASEAIDNLVKGKSLPQKGKLLQSVMEAGPLLQTLLVAGPLPRWRNPPPLQPFKIPPVSIKEMSCGSSQMCSSSMLNFMGGAASGSFLNNGGILTSGASINSEIPIAKRQRFQ